MSELLVVGVVLLLAFSFDFINGVHDAANSIATVVSTRVLSPRLAVAWAAFFNFIAYLIFPLAVAKTIGKGTVDSSAVTLAVVSAGLIGAIVWNVITWWGGIPSSSSHALVGGFSGAAVAHAGFGCLKGGALAKIGVFILVAPIMGMVLGLRADGRDLLDGPALAAGEGQQDVPPAPARVGRRLQPGARGQRRPEDDGDHLRGPDRGEPDGPGLVRLLPVHARAAALGGPRRATSRWGSAR